MELQIKLDESDVHPPISMMRRKSFERTTQDTR